MIYIMSEKMYWDNRMNMENRNVFFNDADFIDYINKQFGLRDKVTEIQVKD